MTRYRTAAGLLACLVVAGALAAGDHVVLAQGLTYAAVGVLIALPARRLPRRDQLPWWLFAAAALSLSASALVAPVTGGRLSATGSQVLAAATALLFFATNTAGMIVLIRRWGIVRDGAALIESAAVVVGLGLIAWVYAVAPAVGAGDRLSFVGTNLIEITLAVLIMRGGARTVVAARLLTAATLVGFTGSFLYLALDVPMGSDSPAAWASNTLWTLSVMLYAVAARHPSAAHLGRPADAGAARSFTTVAMLALAALLPPAILLAQAAQGRVTAAVPAAAASAVLVLLLVLRVGQLLRDVRRQAAQLHALAHRDELTSLPNRRAWHEAAASLATDPPTEAPAAAVALLDLDRFKLFNDTHGHAAGDELLRAAGEAWRGCLRPDDVLARYGGEEFVMLIPSPDLNVARGIVERLQLATPSSQSFSAGLARWEFGEPVEAAIARADEALYRAKADGRRRIYTARTP